MTAYDDLGIRESIACVDRTWVTEAIRRVEADSNRSADTYLHVFPLPAAWGIDLKPAPG